MTTFTIKPEFWLRGIRMGAVVSPTSTSPCHPGSTQNELRPVDRSKKPQSNLAATLHADVYINHVPVSLH